MKFFFYAKKLAALNFSVSSAIETRRGFKYFITTDI